MAATYTCKYADRDTLFVRESEGDMVFEGRQPDIAGLTTRIRLAPRDLRALRDQITAHLGDVPKPEPLPVGTIVTGKGLTEAQKSNLPNLDYLKDFVHKMGQNVSGMSWHDTEEGYSFWDAVHKRLADLRKSVADEKMRREKAPEPFKIFAVEVSHGTNSYREPRAIIRINNQQQMLSASNTRALAAALIQHADASEKSS